ncbi:MAG: hypothetical protein LBQ44_00405 [Treponema sp.]|jgi:hypothetical protein|nr:hypothetical protein [Treponema sp.]
MTAPGFFSRSLALLLSLTAAFLSAQGFTETEGEGDSGSAEYQDADYQDGGDFGFDDGASGPDGEGFGFDDGASGGGGFGFSGGGASGISAGFGGELTGELLMYTDVAGGNDFFGNRYWANTIKGKLNFSVSAPSVDGFVGLKLNFPGELLRDPLVLDEAYFRLTLRDFEAQLGFCKLTWGKADSLGPLDIINPLDYSDLTDMTDLIGMKIARPMLRLTYRFGDFTKIEGLYIPWFRAYKLDLGGRWRPAQLAEFGSQLSTLESLLALYGGGVYINGDPFSSAPAGNPLSFYYDRVDEFDHPQGGLRFTTTLGSTDLGVQYYTGYFSRPSVSGKLWFDVAPLPPPPVVPKVAFDYGYNRFHQIGFDYARVLGGFNLRAEAGMNLTGDFSGNDAAVENPAFVWSLGFDRDLVWGINLNIQGTGSVILMYDRIQNTLAEKLVQAAQTGTAQPGVMDCESGKDPSSTRITAQISKRLLRDELEIKCTALWGIEDRDFLIIPAVVWTRGDLSLEGSAGIFGGDRGGELGQYTDNTFIKAALTWKF